MGYKRRKLKITCADFAENREMSVVQQPVSLVQNDVPPNEVCAANALAPVQFRHLDPALVVLLQLVADDREPGAHVDGALDAARQEE